MTTARAIAPASPTPSSGVDRLESWLERIYQLVPIPDLHGGVGGEAIERDASGPSTWRKAGPGPVDLSSPY